jgi:IS5 family transposase
VLLAECERGFIATHRAHKGNPPDAAQLVGAVTDVIALTGRLPGTVAGDRGFGTAANDAALAELGVARVGLARRGTPSKARAAHEQTRAFKRMRNWRVGIEARISQLKRSFGLRRTRLRRLGGATVWVGLGILPTTCSA